MDYGTFLNMVEEKQVDKVQIEGDYIYFVDKAEKPAFYQTTTFDDPELVDRLRASGVKFFSDIPKILRFA